LKALEELIYCYTENKVSFENIYISAIEAQIIVNLKFTNHNKFVFGKTGWVIPDLLRCEKKIYHTFWICIEEPEVSSIQ
jgi:hypothetical protein